MISIPSPFLPPDLGNHVKWRLCLWSTARVNHIKDFTTFLEINYVHCIKYCGKLQGRMFIIIYITLPPGPPSFQCWDQVARMAPRTFSTTEGTGNLNPVTIARENYRCRLCHLTPMFIYAASRHSVCNSEKLGGPGDKAISYRQGKFWENTLYSPEGILCASKFPSSYL